MKVIITGSTGMVGKGVLFECLDNRSIDSVLIINRETVGLKHPKLKEIIHKDFFDLSTIHKLLTEHIEGEKNRRLLIWSLLNFEWWLNKFLS